MPGEIAPSHRHSPNALRFMIEGDGAYTAVDGERVPMHPGDFIVTPSWRWHDHGHEGTGPAVWMDGLDTPFAAFFGALFREDHPRETHPLTCRPGEAAARYGALMLPVDNRSSRRGATPLLSYPYARSREALALLAAAGDPHPAQGYRLRYANPATGGHPFPTMAVYMQWLPARFAGQTYRSTESAVLSVVEGRGSTSFSGRRFDWAPHDVFVVPPWESYRLAGEEENARFSHFA